MFSAYGQVGRASVVMDRETGRSRGFGFVEMPNDNEAQAAIAALNGKDMGGRALVVNIAKPREGGGGGRGGGGGGWGGGGGRGGRGGGAKCAGHHKLWPIEGALRVRSHAKRDCRNRHHLAALASVSGGTAVRGGDTSSPQGWRSAVHDRRLGRRLLPSGAGPAQGRDHLPARRQPHTRGPWSGFDRGRACSPRRPAAIGLGIRHS